MIVSITGGGGFVGEHLVERYLEQRAEVRLLSRRPSLSHDGVNYFVGDLSKPGSDFSDFVNGADVIFHCAGEIKDETLMQQLHVNGTQQLLEASKGRVGRWIQLSSVGAYGVCRKDVVTEESPERPLRIYEQTKTEADRIVKKSGIPYVILRPSAVFGLKMRNKSLYQLLNMVKKGLFFYLGKEGALVNYVHVKDVVEALVLCAKDDRALGNTYNLSQTIKIEKMVNSFLSGLNIERRPLRFPERPIRLIANYFGLLPGFPLTVSRIDALTGFCCYDSKKIIEELDFKFDSSLEDSFKFFASKK